MKQVMLDGTTPIPVGGATTEGGVTFVGTIGGTGSLYYRLQIEAIPVSQSFTGIPNAESSPASELATVSVPVPFGAGPHKWRARRWDVSLNVGTEWLTFGGNRGDEADFVVGNPADGGTTVIQQITKRKCGLLGIEGPLVLGLILLLRRRRRIA